MTTNSQTPLPAAGSNVAAPRRLPLARCFIAMVAALDGHIDAERDLDRTALADPAYQRRLDRAETANLRLYDVLAQLTAMPASDATTAPLRRMALIVATLVREGTAAAFHRYADSRDDLAEFLVVPGDGPVESRVRHMIAAADRRIAAMADLSLYRSDGETLQPEPIAA